VRKLQDKIRVTRKPVFVFRNLPTFEMTEEQAADYFWSKLGINIDPSCLSVSGLTCMAVLTPESLVDYFGRAMRDLPVTVGIFEERHDRPRI